MLNHKGRELIMIKDKFPMLSVLHAEGPASDIKTQMKLYGQFVGSWEGRVIVYRADGSQQEKSCEVHFGWVLEGRAIQDVWIAPARKNRQDPNRSTKGDLYGTTLRVYDPKNDLWHITWMNPFSQKYNRMTGRKIGEDIVQEYRTEDGMLCQWCFKEITDNSFHWIGQISKDEGQTWDIDNEFFDDSSPSRPPEPRR
jgi:hypothetical protein